MHRHLLTTLLLTLVLTAVVAPTAAPASRAYTAGHFELVIDGHAVYDGPGELLSANTLVLSGARTPALESWAKSGDLRSATVVQGDDSGRVVTYSIINAWPKHIDDGVAITFGSIAP
jgi:hypothetical protein